MARYFIGIAYEKSDIKTGVLPENR
jgi:hypothetical protein